MRIEEVHNLGFLLNVWYMVLFRFSANTFFLSWITLCDDNFVLVEFALHLHNTCCHCCVRALYVDENKLCRGIVTLCKRPHKGAKPSALCCRTLWTTLLSSAHLRNKNLIFNNVKKHFSSPHGLSCPNRELGNMSTSMVMWTYMFTDPRLWGLLFGVYKNRQSHHWSVLLRNLCVNAHPPSPPRTFSSFKAKSTGRTKLVSKWKALRETILKHRSTSAAQTPPYVIDTKPVTLSLEPTLCCPYVVKKKKERWWFVIFAKPVALFKLVSHPSMICLAIHTINNLPHIQEHYIRGLQSKKKASDSH